MIYTGKVLFFPSPTLPFQNKLKKVKTGPVFVHLFSTHNQKDHGELSLLAGHGTPNNTSLFRPAIPDPPRSHHTRHRPRWRPCDLVGGRVRASLRGEWLNDRVGEDWRRHLGGRTSPWGSVVPGGRAGPGATGAWNEPRPGRRTGTLKCTDTGFRVGLVRAHEADLRSPDHPWDWKRCSI